MAGQKTVMVVGLDPGVVDFTPFPGLTKEMVAATLEAEFAKLRALGYAVHPCLTDLGATAEAQITGLLTQHSFDCVVFGAGLRLPPTQVALFEKLLNLVHRHAPSAAICFNTNPGDTVAAVQRWV